MHNFEVFLVVSFCLIESIAHFLVSNFFLNKYSVNIIHSKRKNSKYTFFISFYCKSMYKSSVKKDSSFI